MKEIKEITVFCEQGDSAQLKTWSNVPYFLTETLIKKGIKVNRVDLSPNANHVHKLFYKLYNVFAKGVFRNKYYTYRKTGIYFYLTNRKIKKGVRQYPNSDVFLFTTYNLTAKPYTDKPVVLFSDWTADYEARFFKGIDISSLPYHERKFIKMQNQNIEYADMVICLFPGMAKDMQNRYKNPNIYYIGNVINSLYKPNKEEILPLKLSSMDILFVGKKHYKAGALGLIQAFSILKRKFPLLNLHIIGMKNNAFGNLPKDVFCYGYLDKTNEEERNTYYGLLNKCRLFINTTPKWGAFSACVEAMYFYTPIIITPYSEFINTFGEDISFGEFYSGEDKVEHLCNQIDNLLSDTNFEKLAIRAHEVSKDLTWDRFVNNMIIKLEE